MTKHRPTDGDAWIVAIHASDSDRAPLGAGVVIDGTRVLTSAHVVVVDGDVRPELWVALPKSDDLFGARIRVARCVLGKPAVSDVAMLHVEQPLSEAARLRVPHPADLLDREWWAYGFPDQDMIGNESSGTIGATLAYGWIRLDVDDRYELSAGFSGAGVWSSEYQAVVALVGETNNQGDGRAVSLRAASLALPDERLAERAKWKVEAAGGEALAAWGWTLPADPEVQRHWSPRSRGVALESETGYRFRGRSAALEQILTWLQGKASESNILVVTGSPGVGKSAVLGRIVTTSDPTMRAALPADDVSLRSPVGVVACAVHAKGKTAYEIAREIAVASSARVPADVAELAVNVLDALRSTGQQFNVVIDALDEAASAVDARAVVNELILPLTSLDNEGKVRVVVGTRRFDGDGDLLSTFAGDPVVVDLDSAAYSSDDDLVAYALATLVQAGSPISESAYASPDQARPVAERIAEIAAGNYLIALIIARYHATYDPGPVDPDEVAFAADVSSALNAFLGKLPLFDGIHPESILLPLAYAESPGLGEQAWLDVLKELTGLPGLDIDLRAFARGSAANFLVESGQGASERVYRLFHQALADALTQERKERGGAAGDHAMFVKAFIERWRPQGWEGASPYAYRSLPMHAARAELTEELVLDDEYVLHTDIRRLLAFNPRVSGAAVAERLRLLRIAPRVAEATPGHRQAILSVIGALEGIRAPSGSGTRGPYRALWSRARASLEYAVYEGPTSAVRSLAALDSHSSDALIATGGADGTVMLWLASTGEPAGTLRGHSGQVLALVGLEKAAERLLVSAGVDRALRVWDLDGLSLRERLGGHDDWVRALCVLQVGQDQLVVSGSDDGTVRLWDPFGGTPIKVLTIPGGGVVSVAAVRVRGRTLLATSTRDRSIRIWDPHTGDLVRQLWGMTGSVPSMAVVPSKFVGWDYIIATSASSALDVWDPDSGYVVRSIKRSRRFVARLQGQLPETAGHDEDLFIEAVSGVATRNRQLLATSGADRVLRMWDPETGRLLSEAEGHTAWVYQVRQLRLLDRHLVMTSGDDKTIRIWETSETFARTRATSTGACLAIDSFVSRGDATFAIGSTDGELVTVDALTGKERSTEYVGHGAVRSIQALELQDETLIIVAGDDEVIRLYDADTLAVRHRFAASGLVADIDVAWAPGPVLIALLRDGSLLSWDLLTFSPAAVVSTEASPLSAVAAIRPEKVAVLDCGGVHPQIRVLDARDLSLISRFELEIHASQPVFASLPAKSGHSYLAVAGRLRLDDPEEWQAVQIVEAETGRLVRNLIDHRARITVLRTVVLLDTSYLLSADDDGNIRLWDIETGECVRSAWVMHPVTAVASSAVSASVGIGLSRGSLAITFTSTDAVEDDPVGAARRQTRRQTGLI